MGVSSRRIWGNVARPWEQRGGGVRGLKAFANNRLGHAYLRPTVDLGSWRHRIGKFAEFASRLPGYPLCWQPLTMLALNQDEEAVVVNRDAELPVSTVHDPPRDPVDSSLPSRIEVFHGDGELFGADGSRCLQA